MASYVVAYVLWGKGSNMPSQDMSGLEVSSIPDILHVNIALKASILTDQQLKSGKKKHYIW